MTCEELQRVLPELEGVAGFELEQHLRSCSSCSELVSDLKAISQQASFLEGTDEEPSPRVWVSIESILRQEGLIREPRPQLTVVPPRIPHWRFPWLIPALATLLVVCGLVLHQRGRVETTSQTLAKAGQSALASGTMVPEEEELLKLVAARAPGLRATYESDLRAVDAYIKDAELSAQSHPNDEIAQQYLMNAYEQKAMVYELAMDRSQP